MSLSIAPVTVIEDREMGAQALALNEQRTAANIKNVVAFDQHEIGIDGNVGDFLRYLPGVAVTYSGILPSDVSVRGMPGATTSFTVDISPPISLDTGQ